MSSLRETPFWGQVGVDGCEEGAPHDKYYLSRNVGPGIRGGEVEVKLKHHPQG
jgi:hypothetical protein